MEPVGTNNLIGLHSLCSHSCGCQSICIYPKGKKFAKRESNFYEIWPRGLNFKGRGIFWNTGKSFFQQILAHSTSIKFDINMRKSCLKHQPCSIFPAPKRPRFGTVAAAALAARNGLLRTAPETFNDKDLVKNASRTVLMFCKERYSCKYIWIHYMLMDTLNILSTEHDTSTIG